MAREVQQRVSRCLSASLSKAAAAKGLPPPTISHCMIFRGCYHLVFHIALPVQQQQQPQQQQLEQRPDAAGGAAAAGGVAAAGAAAAAAEQLWNGLEGFGEGYEEEEMSELGFGDLEDLLDEQQLQQELGEVLPEGWEVMQVGVGGRVGGGRGGDQQQQQRDVMLSLAGPAAAAGGGGGRGAGGAAAAAGGEMGVGAGVERGAAAGGGEGEGVGGTSAAGAGAGGEAAAQAAGGRVGAAAAGGCPASVASSTSSGVAGVHILQDCFYLDRLALPVKSRSSSSRGSSSTSGRTWGRSMLLTAAAAAAGAGAGALPTAAASGRTWGSSMPCTAGAGAGSGCGGMGGAAARATAGAGAAAAGVAAATGLAAAGARAGTEAAAGASPAAAATGIEAASGAATAAAAGIRATVPRTSHQLVALHCAGGQLLQLEQQNGYSHLRVLVAAHEGREVRVMGDVRHQWHEVLKLGELQLKIDLQQQHMEEEGEEGQQHRRLLEEGDEVEGKGEEQEMGEGEQEKQRQQEEGEQLVDVRQEEGKQPEQLRGGVVGDVAGVRWFGVVVLAGGKEEGSSTRTAAAAGAPVSSSDGGASGRAAGLGHHREVSVNPPATTAAAGGGGGGGGGGGRVRMEETAAGAATEAAAATAGAVAAASHMNFQQQQQQHRQQPELVLASLLLPVLPGAVCRELQQLLEGAVATGMDQAVAYHQVIQPLLSDVKYVLQPADSSSGSSGRDGMLGEVAGIAAAAGSSRKAETMEADATSSSSSDKGNGVKGAAVAWGGGGGGACSGEGNLHAHARASLSAYFQMHGLSAFQELLGQSNSQGSAGEAGAGGGGEAVAALIAAAGGGAAGRAAAAMAALGAAGRAAAACAVAAGGGGLAAKRQAAAAAAEVKPGGQERCRGDVEREITADVAASVGRGKEALGVSCGDQGVQHKQEEEQQEHEQQKQQEEEWEEHKQQQEEQQKHEQQQEEEQQKQQEEEQKQHKQQEEQKQHKHQEEQQKQQQEEQKQQHKEQEEEQKQHKQQEEQVVVHPGQQGWQADREAVKVAVQQWLRDTGHGSSRSMTETTTTSSSNNRDTGSGCSSSRAETQPTEAARRFFSSSLGEMEEDSMSAEKAAKGILVGKSKPLSLTTTYPGPNLGPAAVAVVGAVAWPTTRLLLWCYCVLGVLFGWRDAQLEGSYQGSFWHHNHPFCFLLACFDIVVYSLTQLRAWSAMITGLYAHGIATILLLWVLYSSTAVGFGVWSLLCVDRCWCRRYRGLSAILRDGLMMGLLASYELLSPNGISGIAIFLTGGHVFSDDSFTRYLTTSLLIGTLRVAFQRLPPPWFLPHVVVNVLLVVYVLRLQDFSMGDEEGMCYSDRSAWTWGLAAAYAEASVWVRAIGAAGLGMVVVVWQEARNRARFLRRLGARI